MIIIVFYQPSRTTCLRIIPIRQLLFYRANFRRRAIVIHKFRWTNTNGFCTTGSPYRRTCTTEAAGRTPIYCKTTPM